LTSSQVKINLKIKHKLDYIQASILSIEIFYCQGMLQLSVNIFKTPNTVQKM